MRILNTIRARQMLRREDTLNIENFSNDALHGYLPVLKRGTLGLLKAGAKPAANGPAMDELTAPLPTAIKA